jgi:putative transposase
MRSNLRWCSDGFEFACWNGEIVRAALVIDAQDREIVAWKAVANAGISESDVRDLMLEAVEKRFSAIRAPETVEWLTDNGSPGTVKNLSRRFIGPHYGRPMLKYLNPRSDISSGR